jgi:ABC-type branched-subunit amino acid transport system substrate-binding protein
MPYPYSTSLAVTRDYLEALKLASVDGREALPNYSSIEGYLTARVLVEGLKRARSNSRDSLITGLESLQGLAVGGFNVNFSNRDHVGSKFAELSMLTESGGVKR